MRALREGVVAGVRGQPWAQVSKGGQPRYQLLTYGTLTRAVYAAWEREPQNPDVAETIRAGLKSVTLFSGHTPQDVLEWLIDFRNRGKL